MRRDVEREDPLPVGRLEGDLVVHRIAQHAHVLLGKGLRARPAPGAAVELVQHRPTPVALHGRRQRTIEADAEGYLARDAEVRDLARRHLVAEPGARRLPGRHAPERARQAREQHEQQQRERQCCK